MWKRKRTGCFPCGTILFHSTVGHTDTKRWRRTWCDGDSHIKKTTTTKKNLWIFAKMPCVYVVWTLTDFYHHSLRSGFQWLFTFLSREFVCVCACVVFSLYRPSFTVQEKKNKKLDMDSSDWDEWYFKESSLYTFRHIFPYKWPCLIFRWCAITIWKKHWKKKKKGIVAF